MNEPRNGDMYCLTNDESQMRELPSVRDKLKIKLL